MNKKERLKEIQKAKLKLELIKEIRGSFEHFDEKSQKYTNCNLNFSDTYEYFIKTFELIDINTEKKISFKDSFFRFFGLLQIIYVQQDLIDAIARVFGVNIQNSTNRKINRELRDHLIGHPVSNERDSRIRNNKQSKNDNRNDKIKSTIILKDLTPKFFYYISYEPENQEEQYFDRSANIDQIVIRHIEFLNESLDSILKKCFEELERQISKYEGYLQKFFNIKMPEINKYKLWFKEFSYYTIFEFEIETLHNCIIKQEEHIRYEVYLVEFRRMLTGCYLEMIDNYNSFLKKLKSTKSFQNNFNPNKLTICQLRNEKKRLNDYFPKANNPHIVHDLRDIDEPYNDLWRVGFNQLERIFENDSDVIAELHLLKTLKSDPIEYKISYNYIRYLVGYC